MGIWLSTLTRQLAEAAGINSERMGELIREEMKQLKATYPSRDGIRDFEACRRWVQRLPKEQTRAAGEEFGDMLRA